MFHLWIGMMAGVLLAYLFQHYPSHESKREGRWWRSKDRWFDLLAIVITIAVIGVFTSDFERVRDQNGIVEALKTILLPCTAGVGFGIWFFSLFFSHYQAPVEEDDAARATGSVSSQDAESRTKPAAAPSRPAIELTALSFALIAVTLIVTEERYGWFGRLQKLTIGGNTVELTPRAQSTASIGRSSAPLVATAGSNTGKQKIDRLLTYMRSWDAIIKRDIAYSKAFGYKLGTGFLNGDLEYAAKVVAPLGKALTELHKARQYNDISFVVEPHRKFLNNFRQFIRGRTEAKPEVGLPDLNDKTKSIGQNIDENILKIWRKSCRQLKSTLSAEIRKAIADRDRKTSTQSNRFESIKDDYKKRKLKINNHCPDFLESSSPPKLPKLSDTNSKALLVSAPYGVILSSLLLYASGETNAAISDLNHWADVDKSSHTPFLVGRFRALHLAATLTPTSRLHTQIEQHQKLVDIGQEVVLSQKGNRELFVKLFRTKSGLDIRSIVFRERSCPHIKTSEKKRLMLVHLTSMNNLAYYYSKSYHMTAEGGWLPHMKRLGSDIAGANVSCLLFFGAKDDKQVKLRGLRETQAVFLDTAASVAVAIATNERDLTRSRRKKLVCDAYGYISKALELHGKAPIKQQRQWRNYKAYYADQKSSITRVMRANGFSC